MAKLILRGEGGREVSLDDTGSVTIGRSPDCGIPIDDSQASRRHCSVVKLQSGYEVADLGSTNGTLLNSTLVKRKKLRHGDVIRIGSFEVVFDDPSSAAAAGDVEDCFLVYAKGDRKGRKFELTQQRTTIGRKESNTLVLDDKVASSYHCEIVRDLNGYTVRDLGSTNGTLLNNEMITEAQLTHGARLRVGNTRFVFQDPTLAEIDLELAGTEDEDADWAMMREVDLAAVHRRNPATIAYLVLFLAILGGGAYLLFFYEPPERDKGVAIVKGNRIEAASFESAASAYAWDGDTPGAVTIKVTGSVKKQGKSGLELRGNSELSQAFYGDTFEARNRRFKLRAHVAARGATARLGLLFEGLGLSEWFFCAPANASTLQEVTLNRAAPPWARSVRVGLRIEGKGTAFLDDVALVPGGASRPVETKLNAFRVIVSDDVSVTIAHSIAPILAKGRLLARDPSGNALDASNLTVSARKADDQHILVTIEGSRDAALAGIEFEEVSGYLSRGGYRVFTPGQQVDFHAAFPDEGKLELSGVRKLLLGPSGLAIAVLPGGAGQLASEARVEGKRRLWTVLGAPEDGKVSLRIKTDLRGETAQASDQIRSAMSLKSSGRWGEYVAQAQRTLAEFPFASAVMREKLSAGIQEVNRRYSGLVAEAKRMLDDYDEFRDMQSLERVREIAAELSGTFQVRPGEGKKGEQLAALVGAEAGRRQAAERERQGRLAKPMLELALEVYVATGEIYSAAVLLSHIAWNLPASPQAEKAREELRKIEAKRPEILKVLKDLGIGGR